MDGRTGEESTGPALQDDNTLHCEVRKTTIAIERCMDFQLQDPGGCSCPSGEKAVNEYEERVAAKKRREPPPEAPRAHDQGGERICSECKEHKVPSTWSGDKCMACARAAKKNASEGDPKDPRAGGSGGIQKTTIRTLGGVTVKEDEHGNIWIDMGQGGNLGADYVVSLYYILADIARTRDFSQFQPGSEKS